MLAFTHKCLIDSGIEHAAAAIASPTFKRSSFTEVAGVVIVFQPKATYHHPQIHGVGAGRIGTPAAILASSRARGCL